MVSLWRAERSRIVAAFYAGVVGIPALFPVSYSPALLGLEGDSGARKILATEQSVLSLDMPMAQLDVDTREDLQQLPDMF